MSSALRSRVASRMRETEEWKLKNQERDEMRTMLLNHLNVYAQEHRALAAHYGENLPYLTGPESAARALFLFGLEAGVLTEHNRPAFVRRW